MILKTNDLWKTSSRESQIIWEDIRQFTIFKLFATQNVRKGKGKCAQPEKGKAITKPRFFFKSPHSGDSQPDCNKCPDKPFPQPFWIFRPGFPFASCPSRTTTSRHHILESGGRGPRGNPAPRRRQPRRYSPEPLGTSDGSGRGLAASRDPRGLAGSGARGRGHVGWNLRSSSRCL